MSNSWKKKGVTPLEALSSFLYGKGKCDLISDTGSNKAGIPLQNLPGGRELILIRGGICFLSLAGVGEGDGEVVSWSASLSHLITLHSSGNLVEFMMESEFWGLSSLLSPSAGEKTVLYHDFSTGLKQPNISYNKVHVSVQN